MCNSNRETKFIGTRFLIFRCIFSVSNTTLQKSISNTTLAYSELRSSLIFLLFRLSK